MKKSYLLPAVSLLGGGVGFALRRMQLRTAFEPDTGLPIPGATATLGLIALSVVIAAALFFLARSGQRLPMTYANAFHADSFAYFMAACAGGAVTSAGAALAFLDWQKGGGGTLALVFVIFTLLASVCMCVIAARNYRLGWRGEGSLLLLVPAFAACLWLMYSYQSWAKDPVVSDYVFALFAIIATMLAYYYMAAYSFGQPKETLTLLLGHLSVFFCIVRLADPMSAAARCLFIGALIYTLTHMLVLGRNREMVEPFSNPNTPAPESEESLKEEPTDA